MGQLLLAGVTVTIAWRAGYRFWLVKRFGGNRVDPDEVHRRMGEGEDLLVIDLRRDDDFDASDRMIAGRRGCGPRRSTGTPCTSRGTATWCSTAPDR